MTRRLTALEPAAALSPTPDASADDGAIGATDDEVTFGESPAHLGERLLAYVIDSIFLFGFTMLFAALSFLNVYLRSDSGAQTASDAAIWQSCYILLLTVPAWAVANLLLTSKRGYTVGQYVMGLRLREAESEAAPRFKRLALYWLALHPLLFHPFFCGFWAFFAYVALSLSNSTLIFLIGAALGLLCLLAPLASLGFLAADSRRRAMHDLLAGVRVRRLD